MLGWLQAIESSGWATWLKESPSIWGYPTLLFLHTVGLAFTVGPSVLIDLRLLGGGRRLPLAPFASFFKIVWIAFAISAASGAVLFFSDATAKLENPAYLVKMTLVVIAVAITVAIRRHAFGPGTVGGEGAKATRWLAVASVLCWFGAITAGRYIAYF